MHVSKWAQCGCPCRTADCSRNFSLGNPTKILSHLRRPPNKGQWELWAIASTATLSKVGPFSGQTHPGRLARPPRLLLACPGPAVWPHWTAPYTHLHHFSFGDLNHYHHPTGYSGWWSKDPFSFRAKKSWVSHLTSKVSVQTPSKQCN